MSEVTYAVATDPDNYDVLTLWRHDPGEPPTPLADHDSTYDDVFWSAAAVLVGHGHVRQTIARTLFETNPHHAPSPKMAWNRHKADYERYADAVLAALKQYATGGDTHA